MIYLDNASTTKPSEAAIQAASSAFCEFGNPSSLHGMGLGAEKIITAAKEKVAAVLGADKKNIIFTSGGTESNNTAIFGAARANMKRGKHLITTKIEHPSVLEPFRILEKEGFEVSYLDSDSDGKISLEQLEAELRSDTILVSVMAVNNETGVVQPFEKIKEIMKRKSPLALFHCDGVQGFCKIPIKPKACGIDLLSMSGHKIYSVKGTGALYIADNVRILPFMAGGGQEKNMRSGTENVPGIAAFGAAAADFSPINPQKREELKSKILENIDRVIINGNDDNSGYILNVSFMGIKAEILLHSLEAKGIYVSTGSACSSNKPMPSAVLTAMGRGPEEIKGAVRFSFSGEDFDTDYVVRVLMAEVENIRKYVR